MSRFYFDTRDNGMLLPDQTGKDLDDLEAAIGYAREVYAERLHGPGAAGQEPAFRVEIRADEESLPVFVLDTESASTLN